MESIKIALLGGPKVGKTALGIRFITNYFIDEYNPTIGDTHGRKLDGIDCEIDILNLGYRTDEDFMSSSSIELTRGIAILYDITNIESFEKAASICAEVQDKNLPIAIMGNKCDLKDERAVSTYQGLELGMRFNLPTYEVSAKSNTNVEHAFFELARAIRWSKQAKKKPDKKNCIIM